MINKTVMVENRKKILAPAILIGILVLLAFPISAQSTTSPHLNLIIVNQTPYPAEPGKTVEIELEVQNDGTGEAQGVVLELLPDEPFSMLNGETARKEFSLIGPSTGVRTSYTFLVGQNAVTSNYRINYRFTGRSVSFSNSIQVPVRGSPEIILENVQIEPSNPAAGGSLKVRVYLKNVGSGTARYLTLKMNGTSELIPLLSSGTIYIGELPPGQTSISTISLAVDNSAEEKTYSTLIQAGYQDEANSPKTKTFNIGIPVSGDVRLEIVKIEPDYARNQMSIEIANKGTSEAKSVEARLISNGQVRGVEYLSSIKASKKTTFTFPMIQETEASLEMNYVGPGLEENNVTKPLTLDFPKAARSGPTGLEFVVIVIAIIAIFLFWRSRRKKKHHN